MARTKQTSELGSGGGGSTSTPPAINTPFVPNLPANHRYNAAADPSSAVNQIQRSGGSVTDGGSGSGGGGGGGRSTQTIRNPASNKAGGIDLRQIFTGATMKRIIGLPSVMADILFGRVKNDSGSVTTIAPDRSDVYVAYVDVLSGIPGIGRLFAPGNIFWRLPKSGDSTMVLKPSEVDGPGVPYVMHGDGGKKNAVPIWLGAGDSGVFDPENLHLEAGGVVIIKGGSNADTTSGADDANTSVIRLNSNDGSILISGGQTVDSKVTIDANSGASIELNAGGGKITVDGVGNITIQAGPGVNVSFNGGLLRVARLTDTVNGTAGPYPVQGIIASGAPNVLA